jgi:hypothetical protein
MNKVDQLVKDVLKVVIDSQVKILSLDSLIKAVRDACTEMDGAGILVSVDDLRIGDEITLTENVMSHNSYLYTAGSRLKIVVKDDSSIPVNVSVVSAKGDGHTGGDWISLRNLSGKFYKNV